MRYFYVTCIKSHMETVAKETTARPEQTDLHLQEILTTRYELDWFQIMKCCLLTPPPPHPSTTEYTVET
jgi:hypothetical protein